jgi:succinate dehydrogenase (ubiquinone) membrane anchor subunit
MGPVAAWLLRIATGLSVWGVYEFNTNDIGECHLHDMLRCIYADYSGLTELVKRTWTA